MLLGSGSLNLGARFLLLALSERAAKAARRKELAESAATNAAAVCTLSLSSEDGTHKTVKARFWLWLSSKNPQHVFKCALLARKRIRAAKAARRKKELAESAATNAAAVPLSPKPRT